MYAIMIMTALHCGGAIICWKPMPHVAQFLTIEECRFAMAKWVNPSSPRRLECRPVEDPPP